MENIFTMGEKTLVRISNVLNLTRQEFNMLEKQIFLLTLLQLKSQQGFNVDLGNDKINFDIEINTSDLKETNRERVKEALDKITTRKIFFESKKDDSFAFIVPFSYVKYNAVNGSHSTISISLNAKCKQIFLELANGYTTTDLNAVLNLKSTHTIRMYELLSMYAKKGVWVVKVDDLKNLLGLEYNNYKNFTDFEKFVLVYSRNELGKHCNIHFEWDIAEKERKKITALEFRIIDKEKAKKQAVKDEITATIEQSKQYIQQFSSQEIAQKTKVLINYYRLSEQQQTYIITNQDVFYEFIRIHATIENLIQQGKPPRDTTKYLAKSLKLDKIKFKND